MPIAPKDWGQYQSWGEALAASGLAALAFNHRMRWNNGFVPGSIAAAEQDLADAIAWSAPARKNTGSIRSVSR